jgi:hypothetical protein
MVKQVLKQLEMAFTWQCHKLSELLNGKIQFWVAVDQPYQ